MRHETELHVQVQQPGESQPQWHPLDIGGGNTLTLDYVSNLLSDVSKIDSGRSFTVKLPRTRRNDTAFDLAVVPQHGSLTPYRYLPCRVYVDGIDVVGVAYMYLVSADATTYNAVIVFGLMREYKAWIDAGKTLKDLEDGGQTIPWGSNAAYGRWTGGALQPVYDPALWYGNDHNINTYTPANGLGKLMYYGIYDPGFARTDETVVYANVHPFVTVREIWERITSENGLDFTLPTSVLLDMEDLAIVLTKTSGNDPQGNPYTDNNQATGYPSTLRLSSALSFGWNIIFYAIGDCFTNGGQTTKGKIKYKGDGNALTVMVNMIVEDNTSFPYQGSNRSASYILNAEGHLEYFDLCIYVYSIQRTLRLTPTYTGSGLQWQGNIEVPCYGNPVEGDAVADIWIENDTRICNFCQGAFNQYWMFGRNTWDREFPWQRCDISVIYYQDTHMFPHPAFRCFPNLPDIKQLDFVKMVCHLYGLFPCQRAGVVDFIPIDELEGNKTKAYDWSRYLLEDDPDAPHHTDWHITDLARRNRASYKEDDKDLSIDEAFLDLDDDTLDPLKDFFTIPLAAADGDTIRQYKLTPEYDDTNEPPTLTGYNVEFTECLHRLMRVVEWFDGQKGATRLDFQNLSTAQILAERYSSYRAYVNQPRILTERLRVPLADLREFDYSVPVFLSKYGRHFAVIDIKWTVTQDTCEAKLLMLGSQIGDVSPAPPPPVLLTWIRASFNQGGTIYDTDDLSTLKQYLTVTAEYSDSTTRELTKDEYTLSGTLTAPSSTITVSFESQTDTFTVQVTHQLPYDAGVEYLLSNGTQYIDTNIKPHQDIAVEIKWKNEESQANKYLFGSGTSSSDCIRAYISTSGYWRFGGGYVSINSADTTPRTARIDKTKITINNTDYNYNGTVGTFASATTIKFFAGASGTSGISTRIYYVKIYDNGNLVADLVPVRKDGVGYMYDAVTDSLLTNNGVFAYGPDI